MITMDDVKVGDIVLDTRDGAMCRVTSIYADSVNGVELLTNGAEGEKWSMWWRGTQGTYRVIGRMGP